MSVSSGGRRTSRSVRKIGSRCIVARRMHILPLGVIGTPGLETEPVPPLQHEALDGHGAAHRRAHHTGFAKLEAALLDDPPRALVAGAVGAPERRQPAVGE